MSEALMFDLLALASALVYGAGTERGRARWALLRGRARAFAARAAALLLSVLALACWRQLEPGPAAYLLVPVGLMALSTGWALLAPLAPRLLWGATLAGALALPLLLIGGWP